MILPVPLLVAARGSAPTVSYRGIGSANGNRTCIASVQFGSVGSKCLSLGATCTPRMGNLAVWLPDVIPR